MKDDTIEVLTLLSKPDVRSKRPVVIENVFLRPSEISLERMTDSLPPCQTVNSNDEAIRGLGNSGYYKVSLRIRNLCSLSPFQLCILN